MDPIKVAAAFLICMMSMSFLTMIGPMEGEAKDWDFGSGTGTVEDPFIIEDVLDLQNMNNNLSAHYALNSDIDASGTSSWNAGAGFKPIGTWQDPFTGSLDGRNFTITELFINHPSIDYVGLFSYFQYGGSTQFGVKNLGLVDIDVTGKDHVGGICGSLNSGTFSNCHVTGSVSGNDRVGGLAGDHQGMIFNGYSTASIDAQSNAGGLAGYSLGSIYDSYSTGSIDAQSNAGGLAGYTTGLVSNSHYNIDEVMINGGHHLTMGGLFKDQYDDWMTSGLSLDISDYSSTLVPSGNYFLIRNGEGFRDLLGFADVTGYRFRLSDDIDLSGHPGLYIPYFRGSEFDGDNHTISNVHVDLDFAASLGMFGQIRTGSIRNLKVIDIDVQGTSPVGGIGGYLNSGKVENCHMTGEVTGTSLTGGLVGSQSYGSILSSSARGKATGVGEFSSYIGGLVGWESRGTIKDCTTAVDVTGTGDSAGALVGKLYYGKLLNSSAIGPVSEARDYIGGLVGFNEHGTISGCHARGDVQGRGWGVGGLVGYNEAGTISDSCAKGNVTGSDDAVGGLVGQNTGVLSNCYSIGNVSATGMFIGGLIGISSVAVSGCFWDIETSGRTSSDGGAGRTTAEMMTGLTFTDAGWDLDGLWHIVEDITYPFLRWQDARAPVANAGPEQIVYLDPGGESEVLFDGSDSTDDFGIFNYTWSFVHQGSDVILYGRTSHFVFRFPGLYDVALKTTDASGNWDVDIMQVAVLDLIPPTADAGPDRTVDEGTFVTFDGSGSSDNVGIADYEWSFADGGPVSLDSVRPSHKFDHPGVFVVTLKVTDLSENSDTDTMNVTVLDVIPPIAEAGPDQVVDEGTVVIFNGSGSTDSGGIGNWTWTFLDGGNITLYGASPEYRFDIPGSYIVTLNVTDTAGHWSSDTMNVTVLDITSPVADAGPDQVVDEGTVVVFDGSGSSDNVGITNWTWTLTDIVIVTLHGSGPSYLFDDPGVFMVTLNVTDAAGNWHTDTVKITVKDITPPVANAGVDKTVPAGTTVSFDGSLSTDNVEITRYIWSLDYNGQERTLLGEEVTFNFGKGGTYEVLLTVIDGNGNTDQDSIMVYAIDKGTVSGTVLDEDWKPVDGALVEITASDGNVYTTTTWANGSFSMEIPYGPFSWKISKEGYGTITGTGTVAAMGDADIDLSGEPMIKEKGKDPDLLLWILIIVIVILIAGFLLYFLLRRKEAELWEEE